MSGTPGKKKAISSRQEVSMVNQLAHSIDIGAAQRAAQDRQFVLNKFDEDADGLYVQVVANMFHTGQMQRAAAVHKRKLGTTSPLGAELAPNCRKLNNIRRDFLREILMHLEREIFTEQAFDGEDTILGRGLMIRLVSFALAIPPNLVLPDNYPSLSFEKPLLDYMSLRYKALGRRLKSFDPNDISKCGYIIRDGTKFMTNVKLTAGDPQAYTVNLPQVDGTEDYSIADNFSLDGLTLESETEGTSINLLARFTKAAAGQKIFHEESRDWEIPETELTDLIKGEVNEDYFSNASKKARAAKESASSSTGQPKAKAKGKAAPKGSGKAKAKPPMKKK